MAGKIAPQNRMTNSREYWNDERLDALTANVESNVRSISELRSTAEALVQIAEIHQRDIEANSADIRGLQLEIRRLVEELRNQRGEGT